MSAPPTRRDARESDRLRELARIGADHAASALASLLGRTIRVTVPVVHGLCADLVPAASRAADPSAAAVFFELRGGMAGTVAVVFPAGTTGLLARGLLGGRHTRVGFESALCEVGNILVSRQISAIADALHTAIVPSVPQLADRSVPAALASVLAARAGCGPGLMVETELRDAAGQVRGYLILIPGH